MDNPKEECLSCPIEVLREVYQMIYSLGAWEQLSEAAQVVGTELMNADIAGVEKRYPLDLMPNLSLKEHLEIISKGFGFVGNQSDFWAICTRIAYVVFMCEKNSGMAMAAKADPSTIVEIIR